MPYILCHINIPDAGATAQVENSSGPIGCNGTLMQAAEERLFPGHLKELVENIQPV